MNHFPFHIGDYLRDTGHLSLVEHGVYTRLLQLYYLNNGPLQVTVDDLVRKLCARTPDEREAVDRILREFFSCCNGVWSHKRADKELEKFKNFTDQQRERATRRWSKNADGMPTASKKIPTASEIDATALPRHSQGNAVTGMPTKNQEPITSNQEPDTPPNPRKRGKAAGAAGQAQVDWLAGLPVELDVPEFRQRWLEWVEYRRLLKKPLNPLSLPAAFREVIRIGGVSVFLQKSDRAMANGWQGFDHDDKQKQHDHRSEKRSREFNENLVLPTFE